MTADRAPLVVALEAALLQGAEPTESHAQRRGREIACKLAVQQLLPVFFDAIAEPSEGMVEAADGWLDSDNIWRAMIAALRKEIDNAG